MLGACAFLFFLETNQIVEMPIIIFKKKKRPNWHVFTALFVTMVRSSSLIPARSIGPQI